MNKNVEKTQLDKQKELFFITLIHDLKTPLSAQILLMEELIQNKFGNITTKQKEILNSILESAQYMKSLLNMLLMGYTFEHGNLSLKKEFFNPKILLELCLKKYSSMLTDKNIEVSINTNNLDNKQNICADKILIRRVIENILNNQIKYAFKNSQINIEIIFKKEKFFFYFTNQSPEISEDIKKNIFKKYKSYKVANQETSTGLGLYLSKQIIDAHKGTIQLNTNGEKNTFIIELPQN